MTNNLKKNLAELGFKTNEIKVYIALTVLGEARAADIAKKAGLPRTTAISILEKLQSENYLTLHRYRGVNFYWVESPSVITEIFKNKMTYAQKLEESLGDLYRTESKFPTAQVIDTKKGIANFIEKLIASLPKHSIIYTIDSPGQGNYRKVFSQEAENELFRAKKKREIITKTLVPNGIFKNIEKEKFEIQNIEIRELPAGIEFDASIWFVNDSMIHFSGHPPFITIIKHQLIVQGQKSIFDYLWKLG